MKLVLASNNAGKIREFQALFSSFQINLIPQSDLGVKDIEETGLTFVENALIKARHASRVTGLPALADDSGLSVAILNGAPGIRSARYAGENKSASNNIQQLLSDLKDIPDNQRQASFCCVLVLLTNEQDPMPLICEGIWTGHILREPRGEMGFGYDPIFFVPQLNQSAAELPLETKNKISHRGIAIQSLLTSLPDKLNECAIRTSAN